MPFLTPFSSELYKIALYISRSKAGWTKVEIMSFLRKFKLERKRAKELKVLGYNVYITDNQHLKVDKFFFIVYGLNHLFKLNSTMIFSEEILDK